MFCMCTWSLNNAYKHQNCNNSWLWHSFWRWTFWNMNLYQSYHLEFSVESRFQRLNKSNEYNIQVCNNRLTRHWMNLGVETCTRRLSFVPALLLQVYPWIPTLISYVCINSNKGIQWHKISLFAIFPSSSCSKCRITRKFWGINLDLEFT